MSREFIYDFQYQGKAEPVTVPAAPVGTTPAEIMAAISGQQIRYHFCVWDEKVSYGGPIFEIPSGGGPTPDELDLVADSFGESSQTVLDPDLDELTASTDGVNDSSFTFATVTHTTDYEWEGVVNNGDYTSNGSDMELNADASGDDTIVKLNSSFAESEAYGVASMNNTNEDAMVLVGFQMSDDKIFVWGQDWSNAEGSIREYSSSGSFTATRAGPTSNLEINPLEMQVEYSSGTFKTPHHTYSVPGGVTVKSMVIGVRHLGNTDGAAECGYMWFSSEEPQSGWVIS